MDPTFLCLELAIRYWYSGYIILPVLLVVVVAEITTLSTPCQIRNSRLFYYDSGNYLYNEESSLLQSIQLISSIPFRTTRNLEAIMEKYLGLDCLQEHCYSFKPRSSKPQPPLWLDHNISASSRLTRSKDVCGSNGLNFLYHYNHTINHIC